MGVMIMLKIKAIVKTPKIYPNITFKREKSWNTILAQTRCKKMIAIAIVIFFFFSILLFFSVGIQIKKGIMVKIYKQNTLLIEHITKIWNKKKRE